MSDERTMETTPTRRRLFSLDEANALVPRVGRLVTRLQRTAAQLAQVQANLQNPGASPVADPDGSEANLHGKRLFHLMNDADHFIEIIQAAFDELQALGCELKDVPMGLVDFRSLRDGQEIYLCWKAGETRITHWHTLESGFAGRQVL